MRAHFFRVYRFIYLCAVVMCMLLLFRGQSMSRLCEYIYTHKKKTCFWLGLALFSALVLLVLVAVIYLRDIKFFANRAQRTNGLH